VLFISVLLEREEMSAQFRHEEYAERLEASLTGEGGQQLVRSKWVMLGQAEETRTVSMSAWRRSWRGRTRGEVWNYFKVLKDDVTDDEVFKT
jgi:hypothetical protein